MKLLSNNLRYLLCFFLLLQAPGIAAQQTVTRDLPQEETGIGTARATSSHPVKCGLPLLQQYHHHSGELSPMAIIQARSMLQRTIQADFFHLSASGRFEIHYDKSGRNAVPLADEDKNDVPDYVEQVAAAADSSWRHQVQNLGFADPVVGASNPYPIFLENISAYGFTSDSEDAKNARGVESETFIVVHNTFDGFPENTDPKGNQVGSIKVTVAHELKHAIQYANSKWYGWQSEPDYPQNPDSPHSTNWSEMDATLMEEMVYDNVNDYYNYLTDEAVSIFLTNGHSVPASYNAVTWFIYFWEQYGSQFWPDVWQRIESRYVSQQNQQNPDYLTMVEAIRLTLEEDYSDTFENAFAMSHLWHYASGPIYSRPNFGFEEREHYPDPLKNITLTARDSMQTFENITTLGAKYITATKSPELEGYVQVRAEIEQPSTQLGLIAFFTDGSVQTITRSGTTSGEIDLKTLVRWEDIEEVGIAMANPDGLSGDEFRLTVTSHAPKQVQLSQNYPNPFNPGTTIEFGLPQESRVQLSVYDVTGRKVATLRDEILPAGFHTVPFNGSSLASGIYFYRLITDQRVLVKKMTLIK